MGIQQAEALLKPCQRDSKGRPCRCDDHPYYQAKRPPVSCLRCLEIYRYVNRGLWKTDHTGKNVRCEEWVI